MKKREFSAYVNKAQKRLDGIRSISTPCELGNGVTDATYEAEIKKVLTLLEAYNTALSNLDGLSTTLDAAEKKLGIYSTAVLSSVGTKYGFDSVEYEKAGGTRQSAIKRKSKKLRKLNNSFGNQRKPFQEKRFLWFMRSLVQFLSILHHFKKNLHSFFSCLKCFCGL
jgi:hypothetical protein